MCQKELAAAGNLDIPGKPVSAIGRVLQDKRLILGLMTLAVLSNHADTRLSGAMGFGDIDRDGDLDVMSIPEVGPVHFYRNNLQFGHARVVALDDRIGNRFGIGSTITIHYDESGSRHQTREIQTSAGFVSFDEPVAHFGLAGYQAVDAIEILWSTGETGDLDVPFETGARYTITPGIDLVMRAQWICPSSRVHQRCKSQANAVV